jgi:hypothetical protein
MADAGYFNALYFNIVAAIIMKQLWWVSVID